MGVLSGLVTSDGPAPGKNWMSGGLGLPVAPALLSRSRTSIFSRLVPAAEPDSQKSSSDFADGQWQGGELPLCGQMSLARARVGDASPFMKSWMKQLAMFATPPPVLFSTCTSLGDHSEPGRP